MAQSIKSVIYQAIIENKWLDISYMNKKEENTFYYIGIKNIDEKNDRIYCEIFNVFKSNEVLKSNSKEGSMISISGIKKARVLENSFYLADSSLVKRIQNDPNLLNYLEAYSFDNNILNYLSECYKLDNDPFLSECIMLDGVDIDVLNKSTTYKLSDKQFQTLLDRVFKSHYDDAEKKNRYIDLGINSFSIDRNGKQYVVAYRGLSLNFSNKTLQISNKSYINKTFLIDDKTVSLNQYLDMNPDDFANNFDKDRDNLIEHLKENFRYGEIANTRPNIFIIARESIRGVDEAFEAINEMERTNTLTFPMKSFFGRNRNVGGTSKDAHIVVFNKDKINIDQMRVIHNAMVNHITFVKGPPGTGKTETIFNVLLSAYANNKTVLVCSNNNHPVNDIFDKMNSSFKHGKNSQEEAGDTIFPILRLGNKEEMASTLLRLRNIYNYVVSKKNMVIIDESTEQQKTKLLSNFTSLKEALLEYENKKNIEEQIERLNKLKQLTTTERLIEDIDDQIKALIEKFHQSKNMTNKDVATYAISASENSAFQNYVYFSSLSRLKKLLSNTYKDLKDIILTDELEMAVTQFNKYLKDDKNMRRLLDIFPIIVCTNQSCEKLGNAKQHFDLCVMDESGQCNIATSLIPIVRAENLLLVGDTNQLQPVTVIEETIHSKLLEKFNIKDDYNYIKNSILSTMLRKDNNSKNILLSYHYRCGKKIASFVNSRFYEDKLNLLNQYEGSLTYVEVENTPNKLYRNAYDREAREIVKIIKKNGYKDVGIITPFVNQANLINEYLRNEGISDVRAGTIHTLQGSEKDVIIMSAALSLKTSLKTMEWVKNNHELINVGVTRAKKSFIFVGDKEAIDVLSKEDTSNDIKSLSDYVYKNGEIEVPKCIDSISQDFSNNSESEKEFFKTISPYFNGRAKLRVQRNVPVSTAIKKVNPEDERKIGKKEFDVIVQTSTGLFNNRYETRVVFEIDGGEHVGSKRQAALDRQKEEICAKYGIKIIRIANSQVKDYELIIHLFEGLAKNITDINLLYTQGSLFEE